MDEQKPAFDGARLRRVRRAYGLTQAELAEAFGVSKRAWGKWESGQAVPQPSNLRDLVAFMSGETVVVPARRRWWVVDVMHVWLTVKHRTGKTAPEVSEQAELEAYRIEDSGVLRLRLRGAGWDVLRVDSGAVVARVSCADVGAVAAINIEEFEAIGSAAEERQRQFMERAEADDLAGELHAIEMAERDAAEEDAIMGAFDEHASARQSPGTRRSQRRTLATLADAIEEVERQTGHKVVRLTNEETDDGYEVEAELDDGRIYLETGRPGGIRRQILHTTFSRTDSVTIPLSSLTGISSTSGPESPPPAIAPEENFTPLAEDQTSSLPSQPAPVSLASMIELEIQRLGARPTAPLGDVSGFAVKLPKRERDALHRAARRRGVSASELLRAFVRGLARSDGDSTV